jgi:hypothetical protein
VAQLAGVIAAGWYFLLRSGRGHLIPNLTVSVECERMRCEDDPQSDLLLIRLHLKKGDRDTISLLDAQAHLEHGATNQDVKFWGCTCVSIDDHGKIDWSRMPKHPTPMNFTPGEDTEFASFARVPSGQVCIVKVAILARQYGQNLVGQWQASALSLPIPPNQTVQVTPIPRAE